MKIALVGYGKMGKIVERQALLTGTNEIAATIGASEAGISARELSDELRGADVAIDFSVSDAVRRNVEACIAAGVPLVEGTTGWDASRDAIEKLVSANNAAIVFGANFSIGVNLFYRIAGVASQLFSNFSEYESFIEEQHHSRKKDAPSGTALKLKEIITARLNGDVPISSTRAGNIPGTHRVGFDGPADQIIVEHAARSREGFAEGALIAAKWIIGRSGFYEFSDVMDEIIGKGSPA